MANKALFICALALFGSMAQAVLLIPWDDSITNERVFQARRCEPITFVPGNDTSGQFFRLQNGQNDTSNPCDFDNAVALGNATAAENGIIQPFTVQLVNSGVFVITGTQEECNSGLRARINVSDQVAAGFTPSDDQCLVGPGSCTQLSTLTQTVVNTATSVVTETSSVVSTDVVTETSVFTDTVIATSTEVVTVTETVNGGDGGDGGNGASSAQVSALLLAGVLGAAAYAA